MEATISMSDNIPLIGELAMSLQSSERAPYVASRNQVTSYSQANTITHQGTNVLSLSIADSLSWCEPRSVTISFDIKNTSATGPLHFLTTDPQCLFQRLQIKMGGKHRRGYFAL